MSLCSRQQVDTTVSRGGLTAQGLPSGVALRDRCSVDVEKMGQRPAKLSPWLFSVPYQPKWSCGASVRRDHKDHLANHFHLVNKETEA